MKTRFAPTPSGFLHRGNVFSFLRTWLLARSKGGKILLRIDDGDANRKRPEYIEDIFQTLNAFGLDWDEGPTGPEDFEREWSQRHRLPMYREVLGQIAESGIPYGCICTRREIRQMSGSGLYSGVCRDRKLNLLGLEPALNWRLRVDDDTIIPITDLNGHTWTCNLDKDVGDFVIRKKDGLPAYQLSSVLDDLHFGVDTIVRGQDLLLSSASQLHLARQLGKALPALQPFANMQFLHHELISDPQGRKLSKSSGAEASGGWASSATERQQLLADFSEAHHVPGPAPETVGELLERWEEV